VEGAIVEREKVEPRKPNDRGRVALCTPNHHRPSAHGQCTTE
jgi:hypothetical protein